MTEKDRINKKREYIERNRFWKEKTLKPPQLFYFSYLFIDYNPRFNVGQALLLNRIFFIM